MGLDKDKLFSGVYNAKRVLYFDYLRLQKFAISNPEHSLANYL